jgi:hypothetical protein
MMRMGDSYLNRIEDSKSGAGLGDVPCELKKSIEKFGKNMEKIHSVK